MSIRCILVAVTAHDRQKHDSSARHTAAARHQHPWQSSAPFKMKWPMPLLSQLTDQGSSTLPSALVQACRAAGSTPARPAGGTSQRQCNPNDLAIAAHDALPGSTCSPSGRCPGHDTSHSKPPHAGRQPKPDSLRHTRGCATGQRDLQPMRMITARGTHSRGPCSRHCPG